MSDLSDEAVDRLLAAIHNDTPLERIERVPFSIRRYAWYVEWTDYSGIDGWTFTRSGARRAIRKAKGGT
jgi:hypothetical protein